MEVWAFERKNAKFNKILHIFQTFKRFLGLSFHFVCAKFFSKSFVRAQ